MQTSTNKSFFNPLASLVTFYILSHFFILSWVQDKGSLEQIFIS